MNKFSQQKIKIFNTLILATAILIAILIIMLRDYLTFKLSLVPDWTSRYGILQRNHELRIHIKSTNQFLQILLATETLITWLFILLNLFLKHIYQGNWSSSLILNNICYVCFGLLFTVVIFRLFIYTCPIMMICDYPYC